MLGESGAGGFCPAGRMPSMNSSFHAKSLNHSISPIDINNKGEENKDKEIEEDKVEDERAKNDDGEVAPPPERDENEMRKPRLGRRPMLPTKAEVEEHFPLHLNYRSWCKHCVAGKARLAHHQAAEPGREKLGVTWNADYAFMGSEEAEEGMQPTLIMYDDDKQSFWALGVKQKGVTESVVKYCVETLDQSGYRGEKVTFKTD